MQIENENELNLISLHQRINDCRRCESVVDRFQKPKNLSRGGGRKILIVGQGPGNSELDSGRAFSGQAGRTLDKWLVEAGQPLDNPRSEAYLTSVVKCVLSDTKDFRKMAGNCMPFLIDQLVDATREWVNKKFLNERKSSLFNNLAPGQWTKELVFCKLRESETQCRVLESFGVNLIKLNTILDELKTASTMIRKAGGSDLLELISLSACDD